VQPTVAAPSSAPAHRRSRAAPLLAAALLAGTSSAAGPAAGPPPAQVSCRASAGRLLATVDLAATLDVGLERRLASGLTSTVRLSAGLAGAGGEGVPSTRDYDVRFDPWSETFTVTIREAEAPARARQASDWAALRRLLASPDPFDLGPLEALPERFTVEFLLELDPVTARQLELTREQLTHPAGGPTSGARSLLGTLASLLLRSPAPEATRFRSPPLTRAALAAAAP
jgi:hypothetical protein